MKKHIVRLITLISICAALTAAGGTAFEFLSVPDGVFTGLGGACTSAQGRIEGIFNNPASLASIRDSFRSAGSWSFMPDAGLASLAGSYTPVRNHVLALGVKYLSYNALEGDMTFDNNFTPSLFSASSMYAAASYGIALGDIFAKLLTFPIRFDLGATFGFARESFDNAALTAVLADAGIIVSLFDRHLAVGGVLKHAGSMLDGSTKPPLPLGFVAGVSGSIDLSPGYVLNLFADSDFTGGNFGIEAVVLRYAYIRAGLYIADRQTDISGGVGCLIPGGIPVHIDYSFAVSAIGVRHIIGAQASFGTADSATDSIQKYPPTGSNSSQSFKADTNGKREAKVNATTSNSILPHKTELPKEIKRRIAVLEFVGKNIPQTDASIVCDMFRGELVTRKEYDVIDRANINKILAEHELSISGCVDTTCAIKVGRILNVEFMAYGNVSKIGDMYYITIEMLNIETAQITKAIRKNMLNISEAEKAVQSIIREHFAQ